MPETMPGDEPLAVGDRVRVEVGYKGRVVVVQGVVRGIGALNHYTDPVRPNEMWSKRVYWASVAGLKNFTLACEVGDHPMLEVELSGAEDPAVMAWFEGQEPILSDY